MREDSPLRLTRAQSERLRARRKARNWALFAVLVAFVVLFYAISIVKMSRQGVHGPGENAPVSAPAE